MNGKKILYPLEVKGVCKRFGTLIALDDVSTAFLPGEVHAVLGENGAGKSTLAAVICGFVKPDAGELRFLSQPSVSVPLGDPGKAKSEGIELIHQHFTLVADLSVAENLSLAHLPDLKSKLNLEKWSNASLEAGRELGWKFNPQQRVGDLSVGEQQRLEIVRVLGNDPEVIVFDEPTAVLAPNEVKELLRILGSLRDQGKIVVLIAHKLSEVMAIADRVTVLRRGKLIKTARKGEYDAETLATWMVGEMPAFGKSERSAMGGIGIEVRALCAKGERGQTAVDHLDFEVRKGEIFGIGGVDGNGQLELAECLAGIALPSSGLILWEGKELSSEVRVAYIPQDRRRDGLALDMDVLDNLLLTGIRREEFARGPLIRMPRVFAWTQELIQRFSIKVDSPLSLVSGLSGGNQQKVVVSRSLDETPEVLIVCNPTRGLDVKAAEFVHQEILRARTANAAVVLISSDLDELSYLADRTYFLSRGRFSEGASALSLVGGNE